MSGRPLFVCVAIFVVVTTSAGCPPRVPGVDVKTLTDAQAVARIHQAAARRQRMVGTVKAKLPGIEGVIASAELDVALQPPASLSVAVRSFFEQPQQELVTDGDVVTLYDATSGKPVFRRGPADDKAVQRLLGIPLAPAEVVAAFLARPPDDATGHLVGVDEKAGTYTVALDSDVIAPCELVVRASDDAVLTWHQMRGDGTPIIDVGYGDLRAAGDAVVPFRWSLVLTTTKQAFDFVATDVTFNGPPLPADAFRLEPPGNVPIEPL